MRENSEQGKSVTSPINQNTLDSSCTITQSYSTSDFISRPVRMRNGWVRPSVSGFCTRFPNLPDDLPPITVPGFARSNFEVGESSRAAVEREEGKMTGSGNLFHTLGIQEWASSMSQVEAPMEDRNTGLLQDVTRGGWIGPSANSLPPPSQWLLDESRRPRFERYEDGGNVERNFSSRMVEVTRRIASTLGSCRGPFRGNRVHLVRDFEIEGVPNMPLTEYDPPNSPVSPIGSIDLAAFADVAGKGGKYTLAPCKKEVQSDKDESIRKCDDDLEWVQRKRFAKLHRWADRGGFIIWQKGDNEEGISGRKRKVISKAITDVDFSRQWGAEVSDEFGARMKGKRVKVDSSGSVPRIKKRQRSVEVTSKLRDDIDEMEVEIQHAIEESIKDVEMGEVTGPNQSPKLS